MAKIINIKKIRSNIKKDHTEFLSKYSNEIQKVIADHKLQAEIAITKLKYILNLFLEENIIDKIEDVDYSPFKKVRLSKNSYGNFIEIITNGESIVLKGYNYPVLSDMISPFKIMFRDIQNDDYDWEYFSNELIDLIHSVIYERKQACETKVDGMFERPFPDDVKIVSKVSETSKKKQNG